MERRKRNEYIIIAILVIGLIVLLWLLLRGGEEPEVPIPNTPDIVRDMPQAREVFTPEQIENGEQTPETVARIFAERFGSYSNQSDYGNVADVLDLATPELQAELRALQQGAQAEEDEIYYGVNTRIVSTERVGEGENEATVKVQTQREEAQGDPGNTRVRYQALTLTLQKSGNTWLVSSYEWEG